MCCRKCNCNCNGNQVGGAQGYPCKDKVEQLKKDIMELEKCLLAAVTPPTPRPPRPGQCHCCCYCYCYCNNSNANSNQTNWGR